MLKIAQFESEIDMGVNPINNEQANVALLNKSDFNYIDDVTKLVKEKLNDNIWIEKTIQIIKNQYKTLGGVKFDDELFKTGRGILENYLKDKK